MSTLFAGGEFDVIDIVAGGPTFSTSAASADLNFSRGAIQIQNGQQFKIIPIDGPHASAWVHARLWQSSTGFITTTGILTIRNDVGVGVLRVFPVSSTTLVFQRWTGAAWTNIGTAKSAIFDTQLEWDIECTIDNSAGRFAWYVNGILQEELTGDTDLFSGSNFFDVLWDGQNVTGTRVSEMLIQDVSTLGKRVSTLGVNGNGANTDWVGDSADVDEVGTANDADFISSDTPDQVETFTLNNLSAVADDYDVEAVVVGARAKHGALGPQNLQGAIRTNSTDFFSPNSDTLGTVFGANVFVWDDNPDTTMAWTASEVNDLEAGLKSIT
jgi:hypothetical protein